MMSILITFEPHGSRDPKEDNKVFLYEGHVSSTSKADIAQGVSPRYLKIE
jgi:hypothetical protein